MSDKKKIKTKTEHFLLLLIEKRNIINNLCMLLYEYLYLKIKERKRRGKFELLQLLKYKRKKNTKKNC